MAGKCINEFDIRNVYIFSLTDHLFDHLESSQCYQRISEHDILVHLIAMKCFQHHMAILAINAGYVSLLTDNRAPH